MNKFEKDFKEWYENPLREHVGLRRKLQWFFTLTHEMQWGVYLMFFDSVGIDLDIRQIACFRCFSAKVNGAFVGNKIGENHKYRQQAQEEAIKKAKLIYEGL